MPLTLTDDQEMLRESARGFLGEAAPVSCFRRQRDENRVDAASRDLWRQMASLGWAGILVDEEFGGSQFGFVGAGVLAEEMGRTLSASPFISTALLAATAIGRFGSAEQKARHLPLIAAGEAIHALAVDEGAKHRPEAIAVRAERAGNGFRINGAKRFVADGTLADQLIVAARSAGAAGDAGGITLFLLDAKAPGITIEPVRLVDSRNAARIAFADVEATGGDVLGEIDAGGDVLHGILNAGRAGLAAELSGAAQQSFDVTIDYLKTRQQFGATIGSFQALQHRAAYLYCELQLTRSAVLHALQELDRDFAAAGPACTLAKAKAGQAATLAGLEAIQMHGGIGMTDEHDVGLYVKRIRVAQELYGDPDFQIDRLALAQGY